MNTKKKITEKNERTAFVNRKVMWRRRFAVTPKNKHFFLSAEKYYMTSNCVGFFLLVSTKTTPITGAAENKYFFFLCYVLFKHLKICLRRRNKSGYFFSFCNIVFVYWTDSVYYLHIYGPQLFAPSHSFVLNLLANVLCHLCKWPKRNL